MKGYNYTIHRVKFTGRGDVILTLSVTGEWAIATRAPWRFGTLDAAARHARQLEGRRIFIVGPRGGQYDRWGRRG